MVKTTLEIKDELYKKLVEASLKKYGNTKNLSRVANEVIEEHLREKSIAMSVKAESKKSDIVEKTFGSWKIEETGKEYVRRMRKGWKKRAKRLGI